MERDGVGEGRGDIHKECPNLLFKNKNNIYIYIYIDRQFSLCGR